MIKVLLADDHEIMLDGICSILKEEEDIEVVATAKNGEEAVRYIEHNPVDVAVLDINMPIINGITTTKMIQVSSPETKVLILSMYDEDEFIDEAFEAGCRGYILKNKGQEELVTAIRRIHKGSPYFGDRIQEKMLQQHKESKAPKKEKIKLTKREVEVLKLIASEMTSSEISNKLSIAESTVNTHRRNLIEKLGVKSSLGLGTYALREGLID